MPAGGITGVREVGFTVISMSLSLVAVFLPLLLMERSARGRLIREFAVATLSVAIGFAGGFAHADADDVRLDA